jgi:hypothetical protein
MSRHVIILLLLLHLVKYSNRLYYYYMLLSMKYDTDICAYLIVDTKTT